MVSRVHTILCEVADMDRSVSFYRDVLGGTVEYESPHWTSIRIGESRFGLHPGIGGLGGGGGFVITFAVPDLQAFRRKLEEDGHFAGDDHQTPSGILFNFSDPDGNRLQAMQVDG
jgi:predicted enzyme related to lactoylglutathione lyase